MLIKWSYRSPKPYWLLSLECLAYLEPEVQSLLNGNIMIIHLLSVHCVVLFEHDTPSFGNLWWVHCDVNMNSNNPKNSISKFQSYLQEAKQRPGQWSHDCHDGQEPAIKNHLHSQRNTEMWKALEIKSSNFFVLMALSESDLNSQSMLLFTKLVKVSNF